MKKNARNFWKQTGNVAANTGLGVADLGLSALGATNVIQTDDYKGESANSFGAVTDIAGTVTKVAAPIVANAIVPGSGKIISAAQMVGGSFNPQNTSGDARVMQTSRGIETAGMFAAPFLAGIGSGSGAPEGTTQGMTSGGAASFAPSGPIVARYGAMIKYKMGGTPNSEVEGNEYITSDVPPTVFEGGGMELASNNPYGTPTYETVGRSHDNGGIVTDLAPGTVINGKTKNPLTGNTFSKDMSILTSKESKYTKMLSKATDPRTRESIQESLKLMENKKQELNALQQEIIDAKNEKQIQKDFFELGGLVSYKDGGIHINPKNKGKFTAAAKRAGMGVQEYASHVLANKENYSSTLVKRANFARNASKWKHEDGGMMYANGGKSPTQDNTRVVNNTRIYTPQELQKIGEKNKVYGEKNKVYEDNLKKGYTVLAVPNEKDPTVYYDYPDSTYFYPNAYKSPTLGQPYITTRLGTRFRGVSNADPKDIWMSNPNAVIRQDTVDYKANKFNNGGKLPESILRSRLESHMSPQEAQNYIDTYATGGYIPNRFYPTSDEYGVYEQGGFLPLHLANRFYPDTSVGGMMKFQDGGKMTPKQWNDYNKSRGYVSLPNQNLVENKYYSFYNPKEYAPKEGGFIRVSDIGKTSFDYTKDPSYNPVIDYSGEKIMPNQGPVGTTYPDYGAVNNTPEALYKFRESMNRYREKRGLPLTEYKKGGKRGLANKIKFEAAPMVDSGYEEVPGYNNTPTFDSSQIVDPALFNPVQKYKTFKPYPYSRPFETEGVNYNPAIDTEVDVSSLANYNASLRQGEEEFKRDRQRQQDAELRKQEFQNTMKDYAPNIIGGLAENIGNIWAMSEKGPERVKYDRVTGQYLDPNASMREADRQARIGAYEIANKGAGRPEYIASRASMAAKAADLKDQYRREYGNINANIANQLSQVNANVQRAEADAQAANDAAYRNMRRTAMGSIGTNIAGTTKDISATKRDQEMISMLPEIYSSPEFKEFFKKYKENKLGK